ncbi:hypothetical protein HNY73_000019 [Argiope bruennichi]|uniref:Uncharacterized protein n=1 Tax=Argiope bruennichi TaxID=94029 RepID=A0A8T0FWP4_ARGBR|nr:hypothetical protein HNY73_000019 [Argiope bruennichi]
MMQGVTYLDTGNISEIRFKFYLVFWENVAGPSRRSSFVDVPLDELVEAEVVPVDNCLANVKNELELQQFIQVAARKLELHGWEYSDPADNSESTTKVLGMIWGLCGDHLSSKISNIIYDLPGKLNKREVLAITHKIFDPLGIACPVTLLRILLQRLWKLKLSWDQEVDTNSKSEFCKWLNDLNNLESLKILR